jgi:hypothetical protein
MKTAKTVNSQCIMMSFYIYFRKLKIPGKFLKELFIYATLKHIIKIKNGYFTLGWTLTWDVFKSKSCGCLSKENKLLNLNMRCI